MHVLFSQEELAWIDKKLFDWTVKRGCPEKLKKGIEQKLKLLKKESVEKGIY